MQLSGPLKETKILGFIPGPGKYESNYSTLDQRGTSIRVKLPDTTTKHLLKVILKIYRIQAQGHINLMN